MKITKAILSLVLVTALFFSCKKEENKTEAGKETVQKVATPAVKPETMTFHIEGMTCAVGCAKTIEEKLSKMNGVQKAVVDFDKKQATVNFDLDKLTTEDIVKAVEATADGKTYKVSEVKTGSEKK